MTWDMITGVKIYESDSEKCNRENLYVQFRLCPIPTDQILSNLGLFLTPQNLSRILFLEHIYKKIIGVHGIIVDFGTRWGQNMAIFSTLRGIYEPFNRRRKIVGFDTFEGFPAISKEDGGSDLMKVKNISVTKDYENYLNAVMELQEKESPISHIKKFEIIKGDATKTFYKYLHDHPETIVSLAYFDFDLYGPTRRCLELIIPHLTKGSILAFDELCDADSPGETIALSKVLGLNNIKIERYKYTSRVSYVVIQ